MSAFSQPIIIGAGGSAHVLERIPFGQGNGGVFSETWLQKALFANPGCLPVREIDPHIGTLIPICMEIETDAGPADILYVTVTGRLVLVETKLWRNPEARRTVVGQILDYAKQLTAWSYEDIAGRAGRAAGKGPEYLLRRVREAEPGVDEAAFVDGINRSLKHGDFLLLIVGDGIRSGAEALVGFIAQYGNLRFSLGLIEVAAYSLNATDVLLQPRILAKTEVLMRTVILSAGGGTVELEQVAAADDAAKTSEVGTVSFEKFWDEFQTMLRLDDTKQALPINLPRGTNFFLHLPPGGNMAWMSTYIAKASGVAGVYLTFAKAFEKASDYFERLQAEREDIERDMPIKLTWEFDVRNNKVWITSPKVDLGDLDDPSQRKRVIAHLAEYTNLMVNAFRHRLEVMSNEGS